MPKAISSRDNPLIKRLKALAGSASHRRALGQTVLDGPHLVTAALDGAWPLLEVVVAESALGRPEVAGILQRLRDVPAYCLPDGLFAQASPVDSPAGILAVIALPQPPVLRRLEGSAVVLDRVQDAGNLGTILRTAVAAGVRQALLTPGCAQAWSPKVLRAGMGAHFGLVLVEQAEVAGLVEGYPGQILATALAPDAQDLFALDLAGPTVWLFGSEGQGLSPQLAALATRRVAIPMAAGVESLNVAAAAAVCLFEQFRQRRGAGS
ncbi:MAG: RNA methyltransferase [Rhodocyclaceae bacterium]|jgi:TrmH family RNA methyltransferase|nr:RNA methyltransferase [Rhodocyclaceae bacterium]